MEREIKFRVWDEDYKKMIYPTGLDWEIPKKPIVRYWSKTFKNGGKTGMPCHKQLCDIMQYTGLKDKNVKESY